MWQISHDQQSSKNLDKNLHSYVVTVVGDCKMLHNHQLVSLHETGASGIIPISLFLVFKQIFLQV